MGSNFFRMTDEPSRNFVFQERALTETVQNRRILIVDDESLARQRLRRFLADADSAFILAEADGGLSAVAAIRDFRPEILFLDVEMPGLNGFEVLAQFEERPFVVVFQTAFDEFAVRAFEEAACDYLLKPFTPTRFRAALDRALTRLADESRLKTLEHTLARRDGALRRLTVKQGTAWRVLEVADIRCFLSLDHYTCAYFRDSGDDRLREAVTDLSLARLAERLDPETFLRVHRNAIVNRSAIRAIATTTTGETELELDGGMKVPVSRRHRAELKKSLGSLGSLEGLGSLGSLGSRGDS